MLVTLEVSPGCATSMMEEAGRAGVVCWGMKGLPAAGWVPWWDRGSILGASTLPIEVQMLRVGSAGCPVWGHHLCRITRAGALWEGASSFLAWKPLGRWSDLRFHFFFMLLEQHRASREAGAINLEAQVLLCQLGRRRLGWRERGEGLGSD